MIRVCPSCQQKNRVSADRLHRRARCGACQTPMGRVEVPLEVDQSQFDDIIAQAEVPVLVDFWAEWCGPCRMAAPYLKEVAKRVSGGALVLKVDIERYPALAQRYQIRGIPNFMVFKGGRAVHRQSGLVNDQVMEGWLRAAASAA